MTSVSTPQLRPLGIGQLLDQAIRLYRRNFATLIGIVAIVQIPITLIQLIVSLLTFTPSMAQLGQTPADPFALFGTGYFVGLGTSFVIGIISFILIQGVATAALTRTVADAYLGEETGMIEAYQKLGRSWVTLVGALLLSIVISLALFVWFLVPCVGWLTGLGLLMFFSMVIIPLIAPVVVLEGHSALDSINRAWNLARRRFWWVLGFVFVLFLFGQLIVTGPASLTSVLLQMVMGNPIQSSNPATTFTVQTTIQSVVALVFSLIYLPLQLTAITLLYFDLRVRTEGFDLALLAESASGGKAAAGVLAAPAARVQNQSLVTMNEMGYFVLVSLVAGVLLAVLMAFGGVLGFMLATAPGGGF